MPGSGSSSRSFPHVLPFSSPSHHLRLTLATIDAKKKQEWQERQSSGLDILSMNWEVFLQLLDDYRAIYSGCSSVVRTNSHSCRVLKVAAGREKRLQLASEAHTHQHVLATFDRVPAPVKHCILIPKLYIPPPSPAHKKLGCITKHFRTAVPVIQAYGIIMERIRPIPGNLRKYLGRQYEGVQGDRDPTKQSCLISILLGCEHAMLSSLHHSPTTELLLTSHELRCEELPLIKYAHALADALAILHWQANLDGFGVKFVLGRPRQKHIWPIRHLSDEVLGPYETLIENKHHDPFNPEKTLALWMFDFNKCSLIEHTKEGVDHLVECYWDSPPWFPRPSTGERVDELWQVFSARYIATAGMILVRTTLPKLYITTIEKGRP